MIRAPGVALAVTAAALAFAAWAVQSGQMWSAAANLTVPWLCSALAIALLLASATAGLRGQPLREVPIGVRACVAATGAVVLGVGLAFDVIVYGNRGDLSATVAECIGFVALLALVFLVPGKPTPGRNAAAPPAA